MPLVLVAPSTAHDSDNHLVRTALAALADEPVRVVATTNRVGRQRPIEVPANAVLVDWLSYSQLMPAASLVVSHGGHGTVARALGAGTPVLICPITGDMSETAMRVGWAEAGLSLPWRLCRPAPLRWAARRILGDPSFTARAGEIAAWGAGARRRRARRRAGRAAGAELSRCIRLTQSSGGGTRTHNPSINSRMLCQLSYPGLTRRAKPELLLRTGIEAPEFSGNVRFRPQPQHGSSRRAETHFRASALDRAREREWP